MNRRDFLWGGLSGLTVGVGTAKLIAYWSDASDLAGVTDLFGMGKASFAQQGEDLIIKNIFDTFGIQKPSYIDIGAHDPIANNNTYLLYLNGSRGVLVEPNPAYYARLKSVRRRDTVLNIGIGVTDQREADYYVFGGDGQLNTFSKEQANKHVELEGSQAIKKVIKMPLVNVNEVLEQHFDRRPNLFSIDVEGMDLDILKALDFNRFRPEVFCVETSVLGTGMVNKQIVDLMQSKDYSVRGGSFVNSIFIDNGLLKKTPPSEK